MNCRMPALKAALERAGFTDVKTVISSGNAVFSSRATSESSLERKCEDAMEKHMKRRFLTIVRSIDHLEALLARDPFQHHHLPPDAKRNVTFLRAVPDPAPRLPVRMDAGAILAMEVRVVCSFPNVFSMDVMKVGATWRGT
jgi:uncharacterized protein (DUF1697 family)